MMIINFINDIVKKNCKSHWRFLLFLSVFLLLFVNQNHSTPATVQSPPALLSSIFTIEDNGTDKIVLSWQTNQPIEKETLLLFVPGPVKDASAVITHIEGYTKEQEDTNQPFRVSLRKLGAMQSARLAVLTLQPAFQNRQEHYPGGVIEITFTNTDPKPFTRFSSAFENIARQLIINHPPLREITTSPVQANPLYNSALLKMITSEGGLVKLSGTELLKHSTRLLKIESLAFYQSNTPVEFYVESESGTPKSKGFLRADDTVYFYAPRSQSPYSPDMATWVCQQPSDHRFADVLNKQNTERPATNSLPRKLNWQEDKFFLDGKGKNEEQAKYWLWQDLKEQTFSHELTLPGATIAPATLFAELLIEPSYIHDVTAPVEITWDNQTYPTRFSRPEEDTWLGEVSLPGQVLQSASPIISITATTNLSTASKIYLNRLGVQYHAEVQAASTPYITATEAVRVPGNLVRTFAVNRNLTQLQVSQPNPELIASPSPETFPHLFFCNEDSFIPARLERITKPIENSSHQADMVIMVPERWQNSLQPYILHLNKNGLNASVLILEQIYDRFGDGRLSPHAIRDALRARYQNGARFSYLLLVGDATWDYWGRYGNGVKNILPGYREHERYAVENWYARLDGDTLPDTIVGRWPVQSEEALETIINKTIQYKESPAPDSWWNHVFFLSDDGYEQYTNELIDQWLPSSFRQTRRHITDYPLIDNIYLPPHLRQQLQAKTSLEATNDIVSILNEGVFLWQYFGHGAPNVLGEERMFFGGGSKFSDVKKLQNQNKLPVLWAFTCETARFDYPLDKWNISIGEDLLNHPDGGLVGLLGATGRGYPHDHIILARALHSVALRHNLNTQGQLFYASCLLGLSQQHRFEPLDQFAWLGDPSLPWPAFEEIDLNLQNGQLTSLHDLTEFSVWGQSEKDYRSASIEELLNDSDITSIGIEKVVDAGSTITVQHGFAAKPAQAGKALINPATISDVSLSWVNDSMRISPETPYDGETIFIEAELKNTGIASATNITIQAYKDSPTAGNALRALVGESGAEIDRLDPNETVPVTIRWDPIGNAGQHEIIVQISRSNGVNLQSPPQLSQSIYVRGKADLTVLKEDINLIPTDNGRVDVQFDLYNQGEQTAEDVVIELTFKFAGKDPQITRLPRAFTVTPEQKIQMGGIKVPNTLQWLEIKIDPDQIVDETQVENNVIRYEIDEQN